MTFQLVIYITVILLVMYVSLRQCKTLWLQNHSCPIYWITLDHFIGTFFFSNSCGKWSCRQQLYLQCCLQLQTLLFLLFLFHQSVNQSNKGYIAPLVARVRYDTILNTKLVLHCRHLKLSILFHMSIVDNCLFL